MSILALILFVINVKSDIPVHCLKSQVRKIINYQGSRKMEIFLNDSNQKNISRTVQTNMWT